MAKDRIRGIVSALVPTALALIAFASNSFLARFALGANAIDATNFTAIRLCSGALILLILTRARTSKPPTRGSWFSSLVLLFYAISFSYAYMTLNTGTGALILFGAVQITMIVASLVSGNRLHISEWLGVSIAFAGFVYLVLPGVFAPSLLGLALMTVAGISWGAYTLKGKGSVNPLTDTFFNFLRTVPVVLIISILTIRDAHYTIEGIVLAALSGAIASGLGYTIWYHALTRLSTTQAAVVQLSVPVIAAIAGAVFLSEHLSLRLILSAAMILGGILLVVIGRSYFVRAARETNA